PIEAECHPEPAKDPQLMRRTRGADPSVACPARSEPASGGHGPALREASLRAEPTGLPCAKRACERSLRVPPQDDITYVRYSSAAAPPSSGDAPRPPVRGSRGWHPPS